VTDRFCILHVEGIADSLPLTKIANNQFVNSERVSVTVCTHDVEDGVMNIKLLDDGGWTAEIRAATGWEVLSLRAAAVRRQDNAEPLNFH
jgi:hypothetical protein